jgi:hypothetical protein
MNMELLIEPRLPVPTTRPSSAGTAPVDFVIREEALVAVVEVVGSSQQARFADVTVSMRQPDGDVVLVGSLQIAVPPDDKAVASLFEGLWPALRSAMALAPSGLRLRASDRGLGQERLSRVAAAHLQFQNWEYVDDKGVLPRTARMWRFLNNLGSSRPAELIAEALSEKVPTIHARINLARAQGLIPPTERSSRTSQATAKEGKRN